MTVEAQQMNLLPSQLIRDLKAMNNTQMDSGSLFQSSVLNEARKRGRESLIGPIPLHQKINKLSSLIDNNDMILQIQQNQSEMDRFVAHHAERVRVEVEKRRRVESRMVAVEMYKGIREKEQEIERMRNLNWGLQDRLKRLCVENQVWRDLARTTEAAANSLREQLLLMEEEGEGEAESSSSGSRRCTGCGDKDSCVLVLPCRHLCLCATCASTTHTCPLCKSPMNATLHLNLS